MVLNPRPTKSNSPLDIEMKQYSDDLVYIVNDNQAVQVKYILVFQVKILILKIDI